MSQCVTTPRKIQLRRDTATNWSLANPILASGEPAVETTTGRMKVGDGVTRWNDLQYVSQGNTGATGPTGFTGNTGPTGSQGVPGDATKIQLFSDKKFHFAQIIFLECQKTVSVVG